MADGAKPYQPSVNGGMPAAGRSSASSVSSAATSSTTASPANHPSSAFPPSSVFGDGQPLPRLFVFDLDYTLWPFWVDTHVTPPLKPIQPQQQQQHQQQSQQQTAGPAMTTAAVDRIGETFSFYGDVSDILQALPATGVHLGVASRTSAPELARDLLRMLQVPVPEGGSGGASTDGGGGLLSRKKSKKAGSGGGGGGGYGVRKALDAFDAGLEIYPGSKLRHMETLHRRTGLAYEEFLFFDDESRNREVETLGVTMCLVRDGVSWPEIERGVREWRRRRSLAPRGSGGSGGSGGGGNGRRR